MEIAELRRGDEVEFFDRLVEGQAYDPWTAQVYPTRPVNPCTPASCVKVTEQNGVLLALPGKRKHWVPLNRIWTKTGMADFVPNHRVTALEPRGSCLSAARRNVSCGG